MVANFWMTTKQKHSLKSEFTLLQTTSILFKFHLIWKIKQACEIRKFHVAGVQWRQRNEQSSMMHMQICCFVNKNLLLFCRSPSVTGRCRWLCCHPEIVLPWWRDVTRLLSMDSMNNRKCTTNFPSTWLANRQWLFKQDNHGVYPNPGTQVGDPVQGLGYSFADGLNKNFNSICDTGNLNPYL